MIYLHFKWPKWNNIKMFIISYIINFVFRVYFIFVDEMMGLPQPHNVEGKLIFYPIITSLAINAIILIILKSMVITYEKVMAEKMIQNLKLENTEAQKQVLMQQLHPHFLFNSLSTLKSLINVDKDRAEDYLLKLSDFLRYSVQSTNIDIISIEKELQFVRDYIDLQQVRFENAFTYEINIPNDVLQKNVPILSIQVLIENIFKHNYFTQKNPIHFTITHLFDELIISNKKVSIKVNNKSETGLANLNKRYQLIINKGIFINNTEDHFEVRIPILS
jgi:two-component system, LytTR family, sensor kinase